MQDGLGALTCRRRSKFFEFMLMNRYSGTAPAPLIPIAITLFQSVPDDPQGA